MIHAFETGASRGEVFEILRHTHDGARMTGGDSFARTAIQELIDFENDDASRRIFEQVARPLAIQLRRP